jgi:hypothetical protein
MTQDIKDVLKLALEFIENSECGTADLEARIKEALAQTQEPVAWAHYDTFNNLNSLTTARFKATLATKNTGACCIALYITPPQRTWVELTNDELTDLFYNQNLGQQSAVLQAIALLKQMNGYTEERNT